MNMSDYRKLASKMDQHMQQLAKQGIADPNQILDRMMGYVPDLHKIWVGTSDQQLIELSRQYPGFYRYAVIMEEASEAERRKSTRPYDNLPKFSELHQQMMSSLLSNAATLERGYREILDGGKSLQLAPSLIQINSMRDTWMADIQNFKASLLAHDTESKAMEIVSVVLQRMIGRVEELAKLTDSIKR